MFEGFWVFPLLGIVAGLLAGFISQPAILAYGNAKVDDDRMDAGFTALFAIQMIAKVLLVQIIVAL